MRNSLWCFALLLLSHCAYAQPVRITLYYPIAVGGDIARTLEKRIAEFESSHPGITVAPVYAGTYKETLTAALVSASGKEPPTLAVLHAVDMHTLIDAGVIQSFDEWSDDHVWLDDFEPAFMLNSRTGGKLWGVPFQRSTILLYWNKEAFREAGLNPAQPPQSWDEMRAAARRLTREGGWVADKQWGIQIPASSFPYWLFQGWAAGNGAALMNAAGTATQFDTPAAIAALEQWRALSQTDHSHPPGIVAWGSTPQDFAAGRAAMIWTSSGNLTYISQHAGFAFGVAALPGRVHRGAPSGGGNFYLFKHSTPEQRAAALLFVRWMSEPQQAAQWSMDTGYIPVRKSAWDDAAFKHYVQKFPAARDTRAALAYAVPELSTHENRRVTQVLDDAIQAALSGKQDAAQALHDAQARAARILRPYQR